MWPWSGVVVKLADAEIIAKLPTGHPGGLRVLIDEREVTVERYTWMPFYIVHAIWMLGWIAFLANHHRLQPEYPGKPLPEIWVIAAVITVLMHGGLYEYDRLEKQRGPFVIVDRQSRAIQLPRDKAIYPADRIVRWEAVLLPGCDSTFVDVNVITRDDDGSDRTHRVIKAESESGCTLVECLAQLTHAPLQVIDRRNEKGPSRTKRKTVNAKELSH